MDDIEPTDSGEWYQQQTPEASLVRYRWGLSVVNHEDGTAIEPEAIYTHSLINLSDLIERIGGDTAQSEAYLRAVMPAVDGYEDSKLGNDEWLRHMRLAPLRLVQSGAISLENASQTLIEELFHTALDADKDHRADCVVGSREIGSSCHEGSITTCPARLAREVLTKEAGFFMLELMACDDPGNQNGRAKSIKERVRAIRQCMISYELALPREIDGMISVLGQGAIRFYTELEELQS